MQAADHAARDIDQDHGCGEDAGDDDGDQPLRRLARALGRCRSEIEGGPGDALLRARDGSNKLIGEQLVAGQRQLLGPCGLQLLRPGF